MFSYRGVSSPLHPILLEEGACSGEASGGGSSSGASDLAAGSSGLPKSASASYLFPLDLGTSPQDPPLFFEPPELSEETIMEPEHLESLSRLQLVLSLSEIIIDLARQRGSPFAQGVSIEEQKAEEIALYLKVSPAYSLLLFCFL